VEAGVEDVGDAQWNTNCFEIDSSVWPSDGLYIYSDERNGAFDAIDRLNESLKLAILTADLVFYVSDELNTRIVFFRLLQVKICIPRIT
jgi:hypothetical protein